MNFKSEVFPTPVSPTRRMVYGAFALFFIVLTIPRSRKSMLLEHKVRISTSKMFLKLLNRSSEARASGIVDRVVGKDSGTRKPTPTQ